MLDPIYPRNGPERGEVMWNSPEIDHDPRKGFCAGSGLSGDSQVFWHPRVCGSSPRNGCAATHRLRAVMRRNLTPIRLLVWSVMRCCLVSPVVSRLCSCWRSVRRTAAVCFRLAGSVAASSHCAPPCHEKPLIAKVVGWSSSVCERKASSQSRGKQKARQRYARAPVPTSHVHIRRR